ncbi:phosphate-selective porin OprO/OprP [Luteimonas cucumeris]|uniref:Phosphate-selective porin OprO/OprP n=1 Tax=Luteimonas cucumeris TaxID=985012 RepID=A0A562L306_9GAMM|nr:porin [Luteimonas cucumeris]TWI01906.1 phosphate-selective porin OprO/OprP [Luteimonas cucumeris]
MSHAWPPRSSLIAAITLALSTSLAHAQSKPPSVEELARRLQAIEQRLGTASIATGDDASDEGVANAANLDQRLRVIERKLELQAEEAPAKAASTTTVSLSASKGLSVKSPAPGDVEIRFKGLVQGDGRFFINDTRNPQDDGFLLRRVEPTIEGNWGSLVGFRITPELAGDNASLLDAWLDLQFDPRAALRIGKSKTPVGLERLQSSNALSQVELGLPGELAPGRDIGLQLQGEIANATTNYALGVYNGAPDGRDGATTNPDNEFEVAARVFAQPWKHAGNALSGLGFGIAGSSGDKRGSGNAFLPRYRTPGQDMFFHYRGAVAADGKHTRWSPQAYYYRNAFGLFAEYIRSEQVVVLPAGGTRDTFDHRAWQLSTSWVLTGEDASYKGVSRPNQAFTTDGAGWGALELVARYGVLDVDDDAFPLFADPATAASQASSWGLALNWYLTGNFKLVANYTHTRFEGGAPEAGDREDEKAFFTRAQFSF